jgi:3-methyladenine DNA glycosylase AlkD
MTGNIEPLNKDITDYLESISNEEKIELSKRWDKNKDYQTYGLSSKDYSELYKIFNPRFLNLNLQDRLKLTMLWAKTRNSTLIHLGCHLIRLSVRKELINPSHFGFFDNFLEYFRGWGNVDLFCSEIMRPLLEEYPTEVINLLQNWNKTEHMCKKRASVVTFTRDTAESGKYLEIALELCDNLIWDKEDLVRKGVGWSLKDNMRADKKRVLDYVKKLRRIGVSSTITLYAIRDIKGEERQKILSIKPKK